MAEHVEMAEHRVVILVIPCDCRLPFVVALVVLELPVSRAVLFQSPVKFEKVLNDYFINSKYVGIDSEWQQSFNVRDKTEVSIIQISNYEETCVILLDMLELKE